VIRHALILGAASFSLFFRGPGCGGGEDPSASGVNAPCERDYDCAGDLSCQGGLCVEPIEDAGPPPKDAEAGVQDAAGDG
jgi:hypothetical protein